MKKIYLFYFIVSLIISSCSSIHVAADYDRSVNFSSYKSFSFFQEGIKKVKISDLDKRRILNAIENELISKGLKKSDNPDLLVNIITKERKEVNIYNQNFGMWGWGWGWGPTFGLNQTNISDSTNGTLFIDLIDNNKKELVWQGIGDGYLSTRMDRKNERIIEFVESILEKYPPKN
ncbi:MAG: DUF4136 domain-containing protein [Flavobacteriaceae bacterium]|jgi:hypothetical protein